MADPIVLVALRFASANPTIRIHPDIAGVGSEQTVTLSVSTDTDYWMSGDGGSDDLVQILEDALNTNSDNPPESYTASISGRNVITVTADSANEFVILWSNGATSVDPALFGWTAADTGSSETQIAPNQSRGAWCPSVASGNPRPPSRDFRRQPVVRGVLATSISGKTRGYQLTGSPTDRGERILDWRIIHQSQVLKEFASATEPEGTLEHLWVDREAASGVPVRYYPDQTVRTSSSYFEGRIMQDGLPWEEDEGIMVRRYSVRMRLRET